MEQNWRYPVITAEIMPYENPRAVQGRTVFNKIDSHQTRPLIRECMPPKNLGNTRANGTYIKQKFKSVNFSNSFFPFFSEMWSKLAKPLREEFDLNEFKTKLKATFKPKRHKHFNVGSKYGNTLMCRVRLGRSFLKAHGFAINLADTDKCLCGKIENTTHFLLDCDQFIEQRNVMIESMANILPNFAAKTKSKKVEILLRGINLDHDDPDNRNKQIAWIAQNYILNTLIDLSRNHVIQLLLCCRLLLLPIKYLKQTLL